MSIAIPEFFCQKREQNVRHSDFSLRKRSCKSYSTKDSLGIDSASRKALKTDKPKRSAKNTSSQKESCRKDLQPNLNEQLLFGDYESGDTDLQKAELTKIENQPQKNYDHIAKTIATTNFKINYQLRQDLMSLNNSFDHLKTKAAKYLSKDLYSTILDSQNNKKNSEDPKFQRIDCSKDESRPSLVNNLTIREIVKNLFTTSQMCDQIIETSPGPPDSNKCEFSSEFGQNLTVQAGVNSESFNLSQRSGVDKMDSMNQSYEDSHSKNSLSIIGDDCDSLYVGTSFDPQLVVDDDMFEEAAKNSTNYDDLFIKFDNKIRMDEDAEWIDRPAFYGINKDILLDDEDKNSQFNFNQL